MTRRNMKRTITKTITTLNRKLFTAVAQLLVSRDTEALQSARRHAGLFCCLMVVDLEFAPVEYQCCVAELTDDLYCCIAKTLGDRLRNSTFARLLFAYADMNGIAKDLFEEAIAAIRAC